MTDSQYFAQAYLTYLKFPKQFKEGFDDWLWDNLSIQRAFDAEALKVAATGRQSYSTGTIIEYLRHYTFLRQTNSEYKLDQNWGSSMARMFIHMHPQHKDLLRYKLEKRGVIGPLEF
jgi:hypothetical protein